jgi:hypothetical protein
MKRQLEKESGIVAGSESLWLKDTELIGDSKFCFHSSGSILYLEPILVRVNCLLPDETFHIVVM